MKSAPSAKYKLHREHSHANSDSDFNSKTLSHVESGKWQVASVFRCNPNQHDWPSASHTANPIPSHPSYPIPFPGWLGCWIEMAKNEARWQHKQTFRGICQIFAQRCAYPSKKKKSTKSLEREIQNCSTESQKPRNPKKNPLPRLPTFLCALSRLLEGGETFIIISFFLCSPRLASSKSLMLFDFDSMFALCPGTSSIIFHLTPHHVSPLNMEHGTPEPPEPSAHGSRSELPTNPHPHPNWNTSCLWWTNEICLAASKSPGTENAPHYEYFDKLRINWIAMTWSLALFSRLASIKELAGFFLHRYLDTLIASLRPI